MRAQGLGKLFQYKVADGVTMSVVDSLEVVDVEHQHRKRSAVPFRAFYFGCQEFLEAVTIHESCQKVMRRTKLEFGT
jgi:hypothetical protein